MKSSWTRLLRRTTAAREGATNGGQQWRIERSPEPDSSGSQREDPGLVLDIERKLSRTLVRAARGRPTHVRPERAKSSRRRVTMPKEPNGRNFCDKDERRGSNTFTFHVGARVRRAVEIDKHSNYPRPRATVAHIPRQKGSASTIKPRSSEIVPSAFGFGRNRLVTPISA
jgi:hypothetical protein